ncbi:hypothetical protein I311_02496 [Cryptococcus gattii NT-10]|nr:hypothetical protein I311_02496 [Cryptococcus gattii NT-10]
MVNPPDMTRPKCQIPANNIEPTLDIGCTPNNHVVEQGMHSVQIPREAQKTIEARKSKDGDEVEEDDVENILSLTLDTSAFLAPEEDNEDTPPSLNLGTGLGLDLKDVTMNNSSTVISSQHKNQHEQDPNERVYRPHNSIIHIPAHLSFLSFPTFHPIYTDLFVSPSTMLVQSQREHEHRHKHARCEDDIEIYATQPPSNWVDLILWSDGHWHGHEHGWEDILPLPPRATNAAQCHPADQRLRAMSVHAQRPGRKVSGTMQYAIVPPVDRVPEDEEKPVMQRWTRVTSGYSEDGIDAGVEFDLIHGGSAAAFLDNEHREGENQIMRAGEEEGEETVEQEEDRLRFQVSTTQDEDEVWMAYVRQQLGVLFPDFFSTDPGQLARSAESAELETIRSQDDHEEGEGNTSVRSTSGVRGVGNDSFSQFPGDTSFTTATSSTEDSSLSLATPPPTGRPLHGHNLGTMMGGIGAMGVPNVTEEISGLREEIMRLRSVVGGLAEELRGEVADATEVKEDDQDQQDVYTPGTERVTDDSAGELYFDFNPPAS